MFRTLKITPIILLFVAPLAWGQNNVFDHIEQAEKSIITVQTELTRVIKTTPPKKITYYRTAIGIVLESSGLIVTNTHTIIHAPFIFVILRDGTKLPAKLIFTSRSYDFSFLRIHPPYPLKKIRWANSSQTHIGEAILVVKNSDYAHRSILEGHIKNILKTKRNGSNDFLELDLDLHHGDSGGPILDNRGRLLGIVMAKSKSQPNTSLAIASNKIHQQYLHYKENVP